MAPKSADGAERWVRSSESGRAVNTFEGPGTEPGGGSAPITVERIAGGGDGVGREESGRVVFVPRTAPGDVVRVRITESKARWARARALQVVTPGTGRRDPPCPSYEDCGGCRLQHLVSDEQRRAKRTLVEEALRRIGGLSVPVPDLVGAGEEFGYRNRVTFSIGRRSGQPVMGYRMLHDPAAVVDVGHCMLAEAPVAAAWAALRAAWRPEDDASEDGAHGRITIRASVDGSVDVLLHGARRFAAPEVTELLERVPGLVGCHFAANGKEPVCLGGSETLRDRWQGTEFDLPADVFLQVNRLVSAQMDLWIDQRAGDLSGQRILDLYSGVGARSIRWAKAGAQVVACDVSKRATEACRRAGAGLEGLLEVVAAPVEKELAALLPADLVLVNPPRTGLARQVSERLAAASAQRLIYVSCDAATLARDLGRLRETWDIAEVQPFDAFPQTAHVETVALLVRP